MTKDADIVELSLLRGSPPKVVWLRIGNVRTEVVEAVLRENSTAIENLVEDAARSVLELVAI